MLVNGILQPKKIDGKVNFQGSQKAKDSQGYQTYEFFLPYDKAKYDVKLEIAPVVKENFNWFVDDKAKIQEFNIEPSKKYDFDPSKIFLPEQDFAYRFKVTDKETNKVSYHQDNGVKVEKKDAKPDEKFVIIHRDRAAGRMPGVMGHGLIDNFNPGYEYAIKDGKKVPKEIEGKRAELLKHARNHFNLYGGNLAGVEQKLPYLKKLGIDLMLFTPFGDDRSNHGYWTNTCYQMSDRIGTPEDYKRVVVKAAKKGINFLNDAAFVNEGLEGVHLRQTLKWGEDSYAYNWIKSKGYKTVSILPNTDSTTTEGKELFKNFRIKVTNGDYKYSYAEDGSLIKTKNERDKTKLTYYQVYDKRLIDKKALEKDEVLKRSDFLEPENHYDISKHNDAVIIDAFPIYGDELGDFYSRMEKYKDKPKEDNADFLKSVLKFKHYCIGVKMPGGFNTWDGNVDVAKLNDTYTNKDEIDLTLRGATEEEKEAYKQGTYQARDYVQKAGAYLTRLVKNTCVEGFADEIKDTDKIKDSKNIVREIDNKADKKKAFHDLIFGVSDNENAHCNNIGKASMVMTDDIIGNVIDNKYHIPELDKTNCSQQLLFEGLMNYPLEAIQFSRDLTGILGSPYLSKRASNPEDILKTRNEFFKENNYEKIPEKYADIYYDMDQDFYHGLLSGTAHKIIEKANKDGNLGLFDDKGNLSDKGKLVMPLITDDMAKFLIIKALAPNVSIENNKGALKYDYNKLREVSLLSINGGKGISASSEKEEAKKVLELLKEGVSDISDKDKDILAENIKDRFKNISTDALKMAYVIVDKTETGANFRTDATKDVLEIDNIRNGIDSMTKEWGEKGIPIWEAFTLGVHGENPNSLIVAEMTDLPDKELFGVGSAMFKNDLDATTKFIQGTKMSTISNYSVLYGSLQRMFIRDFESGSYGGDEVLVGSVVKAMTGENAGWTANVGFLNNLPNDSVKNLHNFVGNHDKPRIMHNLTLDMGVFYNNNDKDNNSQKTIEKLTQIYAPGFEEKTGTKPDTKALAMAKVVGESLIPMIDDKEIGIKDKQNAKEALLEGIQSLVRGEYKGKTFEPDNFAAVSIDTALRDVITQADYMGKLKLSEKQTDLLVDKASELATAEPEQKSHIINELLVSMPGHPTFYMGDQLKATGYETACKNIYVKNRSIIDWESMSKAHIKNFHDETEKILNIRKIKGLEALSNGETTYFSPISKNEKGEKSDDNKAMAMFRYDDNSEVLVLAHNANISKQDHIVENPLNIILKDENGKKSISNQQDKAIHGTDIVLDTKAEHEIEEIDLTPRRKDNKEDGFIQRGLLGGLAVGTMFKDARETAAEVYGVCAEKVNNVTKYVIKQFKDEGTYKQYDDAFKSGNHEKAVKILADEAKAIKLKKNVMFLKKVAFRGRQDSNYIKIQAYLNSKTYLNEKPKYASLKNA